MGDLGRRLAVLAWGHDRGHDNTAQNGEYFPKYHKDHERSSVLNIIMLFHSNPEQILSAHTHEAVVYISAWWSPLYLSRSGAIS